MFDPNIHHRRSIRLAGYDYAQQGAYFVTVRVLRRGHIFGCVNGDDVRLNPYGQIVRDYWLNVPHHFPHVELDQWIVMPDHFHAILFITNANAPENKPGGLGSVMGYFKYQNTKQINEYRDERNLGPVRVWQRGYFDRIIRNEKELHDTRRYIQENPLRWPNDVEPPQ